MTPRNTVLTFAMKLCIIRDNLITVATFAKTVNYG